MSIEHWWDVGPRRTPFSMIDLDHNQDRRDLMDCLETMDVELEEAVLVIRGKHQGRDIEFMVGNLETQGPGNGMVLIHRSESVELRADYTTVRTLVNDEYRLLLDCELQPDKNGHAYSIRITEEQG